MGCGDCRSRRCIILSVLLLIIIIITVVLGVLLTRKPFKQTFIERCKKFGRDDCEKLWGLFEQAYVGRDPCNVPMEAYNPLIAAAPFTHSCKKTMLWSKTKDLVHPLTAKRNDCFVTGEDTLLGNVLDGLTWCGEEGSNETFTTGCPGWTNCEKNTVRSFWTRVSAAFADFACDDVTVMLKGTTNTTFDPDSVFATVELKSLRYPKVKSLNVLVTTKNAVANCASDSLQKLQNQLNKGITYNCKEVAEDQIEECRSDPGKPCGACW